MGVNPLFVEFAEEMLDKNSGIAVPSGTAVKRNDFHLVPLSGPSLSLDRL
jgi:hypothetical protein